MKLIDLTCRLMRVTINADHVVSMEQCGNEGRATAIQMIDGRCITVDQHITIVKAKINGELQ